MERKDIAVHIGAHASEAAMDPYQYIGTAVEHVDAGVARLRTRV